jgi:2-methylfumaryl-CoA hydratase
VQDISLNAVANLGYAAGRFGHPVYPGDTLSADSTVIGLKENSDGRSGIVHVRSCGVNQRGQIALEYCRWVMVRKRDPQSPAPADLRSRRCPTRSMSSELVVPAGIRLSQYDSSLAGSDELWEDYAAGERIDHVDGMTIEESEHMLATRLYQNASRVHFNQQSERGGRFGRASSMAGTSSAWRARCRSTAWPMPSASPPSMAGGTSARPSPATPSTRGRKSSSR